MKNKENKKSKIFTWLSTSASIVGLIVGIFSIGTNLFIYKKGTEECTLEKVDSRKIIQLSDNQYIGNENLDTLLQAIQRERLTDIIYCSYSNQIFNKKSELDKIVKNYREVQGVYLNLQSKNKQLYDEIKGLQKRLIIQEERSILELSGKGSSGKVGAGMFYQSQVESYNRYKNELDSLIKIYNKREDFYLNSVTVLNKKIEELKK